MVSTLKKYLFTILMRNPAPPTRPACIRPGLNKFRKSDFFCMQEVNLKSIDVTPMDFFGFGVL